METIRVGLRAQNLPSTENSVLSLFCFSSMKMTFKERIAGALKFLMSGPRQSFFGGIISPGKITRRVSAEQDPYSNFAGWTYFAIDKIAERVANIEFELYQLSKKGEVEEVEDHEVLSLLYRANPIMTKAHMMYLLSVYFKLWGAAPIFKERIGRKVVNLYPMRPDLLKMRQNENGDIVAWEYWVGGKMVQFDKEDVLYILRPDPKNPIKGYGNFQAAAIEIDADTAAVVWNKYFFENNAEPGGVLETDQSLSDETFERLKKTWYARYGGSSNAGKTAILEAGLKWKATEQTGKEAGYIETRAFNRDTILTLFGVPKGLFIADDVNLANAEVAENIFLSQTVDPMMRWFVDHINEFLLPEFGDNLLLSYESPVKEDRSQKLEEAKAGTNSWQTINETRKAYNLPPVDGGDVLYLPFSLAPMGELQISDGGEKRLELRVKANVPSRKQEKIKRMILAKTHFKRKMIERISEKAADKIIQKSKKFIVTNLKFKSDGDSDSHENVHSALVSERKIYLKNVSKREKSFREKLVKLFSDQEAEVKKRLEEEGVPKSQKSPREWLERVVSVLKTNVLADILRGEYFESINEGALSIAGILGADMVDIGGTPEVVDYLRRMPNKFSSAINETTMNALRAQLSEGADAGESMAQLSDRVAAVFDDARSYRTDRIARTEVGRAQNFGRFGEMKALGVEERVWMAIFQDTRDSHAAAHGQKVGINSLFSVGGYDCMYPQDSGLPASESINCQCSVSPYIPKL